MHVYAQWHLRNELHQAVDAILIQSHVHHPSIDTHWSTECVLIRS